MAKRTVLRVTVDCLPDGRPEAGVSLCGQTGRDSAVAMASAINAILFAAEELGRTSGKPGSFANTVIDMASRMKGKVGNAQIAVWTKGGD